MCFMVNVLDFTCNIMDVPVFGYVGRSECLAIPKIQQRPAGFRAVYW